jgi:hypothetical protein
MFRAEDQAMADPADEDQIPPDQSAAEPGAQDEQQTPGDQAGARPSEEGDPPQPAGDDSQADSDPLALAQQEPEPVAEPQPKPTPTGKPQAEAKPPNPQPTTKQPAPPSDTPAPADPDAIDPQELKEALADLPAEDWRDGKLSHKSKSQYLSQRKVIQKQQQQLKQIEPLRKAKADLDQIEKLRQDAGLEPNEFIQGAILRAQLKRGDPRAIPVLEQTLATLRQRAGGQPPAATQPPPQAPPAPAFDPAQVLADIEEAEANFDFDRLAGLKDKLRGAAKPPAQQQPPQGAPPVQPPAAPPQPAPPAAEPGAQVDGEMAAMAESLAGLGVADPVAHVRDLMTRFPELGKTPPGQRLRAVLAKHREATGVQPPPPRQPAGPHLSVRGGPVRRGGSETPHDPLKHAIRR